MKKEVFLPLIIILLGFLFVCINLLVYFSKGNAWLISRKLKIGALLLSLTGVVACGSPLRPTCYEQPPSKEYRDSVEKARKQDSINEVAKLKHIHDSLEPPVKKCYAPHRPPVRDNSN